MAYRQDAPSCDPITLILRIRTDQSFLTAISCILKEVSKLRYFIDLRSYTIIIFGSIALVALIKFDIFICFSYVQKRKKKKKHTNKQSVFQVLRFALSQYS